MKTIHLTAYGNPAQNLSMVEVSEPNAPSASEALVRMEYAPIDYSDLLLANAFSKLTRNGFAESSTPLRPGCFLLLVGHRLIRITDRLRTCHLMHRSGSIEHFAEVFRSQAALFWNKPYLRY